MTDSPEMMSAASLCSGYGGLEMGAGMVLPLSVRWHSEVDPDASQTLKAWWPDVPNLGDFTTPDFWTHAERVDVELGGVPCQPFSAAGRQAGEDDPRHLWPAWLRGIRRRLPSMIVFENVANLTRGKMRPTFDAIGLALAELGYDVRWCLLGACAVGAAHHRHRVFLVAQRTNTIGSVREVKVVTCGQSVAAYLPTPRAVDATRGPVTAERMERTGRTAGIELASAVNLLPTPRARDGRVQGETGAELRRREAGRRNGVALSVEVSLLPTPNARDGAASRGQGTPEAMARRVDAGHQINLGDAAVLGQADPERWGRYAEAIARHESVLGRSAPAPTEIGPRGGRRLAAAFSEWLMMLPEGHLTSVLERNPALARAGNGVVPLQAATAIHLLLGADDAHQA